MNANKTFEIKYKNNGSVIFVNELDKKDKVNTNVLLCFFFFCFCKVENYKDVDGYFDGCNCFVQNSYSMDFYRLSECGEQLTNF